MRHSLWFACIVLVAVPLPRLHARNATLTAEDNRRIAVNADIVRSFTEDPAYAESVVNDARFAVNPTLFRHPERKPKEVPKKKNPANYDYLFKEWSLHEGVRFLDDDGGVLETEEGQFGIPGEFTAGIHGIETQFGKHATLYPVLTSLYTIAVRRPHFQKDPRWAVKEIVAFLTICRRLDWDPFLIMGSWAGAIGLPQFEPTSYLRLAMRFDGMKCVRDEKLPNLFDEADSKCSVGNYLRRVGFGQTEAARRHAVWNYNHSPRYVAAVLDYADVIAGRPWRRRYTFVSKDVEQELRKFLTTRAARK